MATYAIGDIQGCFSTFMGLLEHIRFDSASDRLWLVGDVVNRGDGSLATLRWIKQHEQQVSMVLGNHDISLIAFALGVRPKKAQDTFDDVVAAADGGSLVAWLRRQPLCVTTQAHAMVHAGVLPAWDVKTVIARARDVEQDLADDAAVQPLLAAAYAQKSSPQGRYDAHSLQHKAYTLRVLTTLRALDGAGEPDFRFKGPPTALGAQRQAWYAAQPRAPWQQVLVTGHWAALGLHHAEGFWALDSGCVWGGPLTALRLEDQKVFQVPCREAHPLTADGDG